MTPTKYIKALMLLLTTSLALYSGAQNAVVAAAPAAAAASAPASSNDYSMYMLIGIACVLLVTIAVLGQVLIRLTVYVYENKSKAAKAAAIVLIMLLAGNSAWAQSAAPMAAVLPAVQNAGSGFSIDYIAALTVVFTECFVIFVMLIRIMALINAINPKAEANKQISFEFPKWFDRFNESVAVEHEKDIMLDHDYDGIKELDNQLPPWWKYGFLLTIVWAICYFSYFHIFGAAPLSAGEYDNEMETAKIAKEAYMRTAKNNVDENTIVYEASYLADGQKIFNENCVACHGSKGEGGVGPNLTDDYWLHGGKINDVFKSVKYGWPANGMKSWQTDFSAIQIAQVVCYVKSLHGTNPPNPKAPQGDIYTEDGAAKPDAKTSTAAKDTVSK